MKLSGGEKYIISMLCDLYKHLGIKDSNYDPELIQDALSFGHTWALENVNEGDDEEETVNETDDILTMWKMLEFVYASLPSDAQNKIGSLQFDGFDANNERHYFIADFLINRMDRYCNFKDRYINSHMSRIDYYREMKIRFDIECKKVIDSSKLSEEQIITILGR